MDHSIQGYLSRRTTEELDYLLLYYLRLEVCEFHRDIIVMILNLLEEREKNEPYEISPKLLALYKRLYLS